MSTASAGTTVQVLAGPGESVDVPAQLELVAPLPGLSGHTRYVLDRPAVAGVIIGARLGVAEHIADNAGTFDLALDPEYFAALDPIFARSRDLMTAIGDCGDEYR